MDILDYASAFNRLAELRFERLSPKYVVNNENSGFSRDNIMDILEEIADTQNILDILIGRLSAGGEIQPDQFNAIMELASSIPAGITACYNLDKLLADKYRKESVQRIVTRSEIGLDNISERNN